MARQSSKRVLVAGIGNIFLGDDAFGVEVVNALARRSLPEEVELVDFGIRGRDLAYALAKDFELVILVDATPQRQDPGTVCLMELDPAPLKTSTPSVVDAHSLDPVRALQAALDLGVRPRRWYLVGCEPAPFDPEVQGWGLSTAVAAAVPIAVERTVRLIHDYLSETPSEEPGTVNARNEHKIYE
jgi:hydrogenase maturation protease